jgi:hypothetical protein
MIKKLLYLLLFTFALNASENFILHNENIISEKASLKIEKMCNELYAKTGVGVYVSAVRSLGGKKITEYEKEIANSLNGKFILLAFSSGDKQIDLFSTPGETGLFDKNEILDDYILPIIIEKRKDLSYEQQYTAGLFNGVAELTDEIAEKHGIVLQESIGSEGKHFYDGLMVIIKILLALTIFTTFYIYYKARQEKKNG